MLYIRKGTSNTLRVNVERMLFANASNNYSIALRNLITNTSQSFAFGVGSVGTRSLEFVLIEPTNMALVDEGSYEYSISATGSGIVSRGLARVHENNPTSASNIYGTEVTYTEHSSSTSNTQYITI